MSRFIHLVDDDEAIQRSTSFMLRASGLVVKTYATGAELLRNAGKLAPGCILLDVRLPDLDGLSVQHELRERGVHLPVIVMSGHGEISVAVQAMKAGAIDFIEKPFEKAALLAALDEGFAILKSADHERLRKEKSKRQLEALTPREIEVLDGLSRGHPNKTIAYNLGISARTVEVHRAKVMSKLGVGNLSDALRVAFAAGLGEQPG